MTGTKLYARWKTIKRRCSKPNATGFENYGGRGITLCAKWSESFLAFYKDVGKPPTDRHTLERLDNNKGYEPGNVVWATYGQQSRNKRQLRPNKNGYRGVFKVRNTFYSLIVHNGDRRYLGSFPTAKAASIAYEKALQELR